MKLQNNKIRKWGSWDDELIETCVSFFELYQCVPHQMALSQRRGKEGWVKGEREERESERSKKLGGGWGLCVQ